MSRNSLSDSLGPAIFFGVLGLILSLIWVGYRSISEITYNRSIGGYLKRAADANTVELAKSQLKIALDNIEQRGLTHGYTSIVYNTPDEDIGFWYTNLKTSYKQLEELSEEASALEKSNTLMKLRETLLDHSSGAGSVTEPSGISLYPNNLAMAFLISIGGGLSAVFFIIIQLIE